MTEDVTTAIMTQLKATISADIIDQVTKEISDNIERKSAIIMSHNLNTLDKIRNNHVEELNEIKYNLEVDMISHKENVKDEMDAYKAAIVSDLRLELEQKRVEDNTLLNQKIQNFETTVDNNFEKMMNAMMTQNQMVLGQIGIIAQHTTSNSRPTSPTSEPVGVPMNVVTTETHDSTKITNNNDTPLVKTIPPTKNININNTNKDATTTHHPLFDISYYQEGDDDAITSSNLFDINDHSFLTKGKTHINNTSTKLINERTTAEQLHDRVNQYKQALNQQNQPTSNKDTNSDTKSNNNITDTNINTNNIPTISTANNQADTIINNIDNNNTDTSNITPDVIPHNTNTSTGTGTSNIINITENINSNNPVSIETTFNKNISTRDQYRNIPNATNDQLANVSKKIVRQARKAQKQKEREQGDEGRERVGRATNLPERKRKERRETAANKNRENKNNKRIGITPPISQEGEDLDEGGVNSTSGL